MTVRLPSFSAWWILYSHFVGVCLENNFSTFSYNFFQVCLPTDRSTASQLYYRAFEIVGFAIVPYELSVIEKFFDMFVLFFADLSKHCSQIHRIWDQCGVIEKSEASIKVRLPSQLTGSRNYADSGLSMMCEIMCFAFRRSYLVMGERVVNLNDDLYVWGIIIIINR